MVAWLLKSPRLLLLAILKGWVFCHSLLKVVVDEGLAFYLRRVLCFCYLHLAPACIGVVDAGLFSWFHIFGFLIVLVV